MFFYEAKSRIQNDLGELNIFMDDIKNIENNRISNEQINKNYFK